jgi:AraC-like DNA-binding protein
VRGLDRLALLIAGFGRAPKHLAFCLRARQARLRTLHQQIAQATPEEIADALALREAGFTALAISQRLNISTRTLQRHFATAGTRKGAAKAEVLQRAKNELMARITSAETIKEEAARLVADDLAHSLHLREVILAASEQMKATTLEEAALVMRAAAAYSTAIKNTSDIIRRGLRVEHRDGVADDLPELVVSELTQAEIEHMRLAGDEDDQGLKDDEHVSADDADDVIELA